MAMSKCRHLHGDLFDGFWICGQCWQKLEGRPTIYGMVTVEILGVPIRGKALDRQDVIWQAATSRDQFGTTLAQFLLFAVSHLRRRAQFAIPKSDALDMCLDALRDDGSEFGDTGLDWGKDGAADLVDECIVQYWDDCQSGANA